MAAVDFSEDGWDIFISFATPDGSHAEDLKDLLEEQGLKVFMAHKSIAPGVQGFPELFSAVRSSRLVAILLSEQSGDAHYQREEIHLAIERERAGDLQVVPIYVESRPQESRAWEFGLRNSYQSLNQDQLGTRGIAQRLGERLRGDSSQVAADDSLDHRTIGDLLHGAALRINRTQQWLPLVKHCRSDESAFFLLHGPRRQNLALFLARIFNFLNAECGVYHRVAIVPLEIEATTPRSAAEWENHLRFGLAGESGRAGTAEDLLREETRAHPVFLVLSGVPIAVRNTTRDSGLDEKELRALEGFLRDRLPWLIAQVSQDRHPVRALLATHYEDEMDSLVEDLDEKAYRGCRDNGIRYRKLARVKPLEWEDIEDYLDDFAERPRRRTYRKLKAAFNKLCDDEEHQFRDVLEMLAREISNP